MAPIQNVSVQTLNQRPALHPHPLRSLQVTSARLLRADDWRPLWKYEVKGTVGGRPVTLNVDEKGLGNVTLTDARGTRRLSRTELADVGVALAAYAKAQNFNPPQGVTEARIAIAEALNGEAPTAKFVPGEARDNGTWMNVSGTFIGHPKMNADIAFDTSKGRLLMLFQVNASSARQRPLTEKELRGLVQSMGAAVMTCSQKSPKTLEVYANVLAQAKRELARLTAQ